MTPTDVTYRYLLNFGLVLSLFIPDNFFLRRTDPGYAKSPPWPPSAHSAMTPTSQSKLIVETNTAVYYLAKKYIYTWQINVFSDE